MPQSFEEESDFASSVPTQKGLSTLYEEDPFDTNSLADRAYSANFGEKSPSISSKRVSLISDGKFSLFQRIFHNHCIILVLVLSLQVF